MSLRSQSLLELTKTLTFCSQSADDLDPFHFFYQGSSGRGGGDVLFAVLARGVEVSLAHLFGFVSCISGVKVGIWENILLQQEVYNYYYRHSHIYIVGGIIYTHRPDKQK